MHACLSYQESYGAFGTNIQDSLPCVGSKQWIYAKLFIHFYQSWSWSYQYQFHDIVEHDNISRGQLRVVPDQRFYFIQDASIIWKSATFADLVLYVWLCYEDCIVWKLCVWLKIWILYIIWKNISIWIYMIHMHFSFKL